MHTARGLKNPKINTPPPETKFQETFYAVQKHDAVKAGPHLDLRIAFPQTGVAHSWAIPQNRMPDPGEKLLATESGDHDIGYMSYQGTLTKGYGRGEVKLHDMDRIEVLESDANKVTFAQYTGSGVNRYTLVRIAGKDWLLLNTTATNKTRSDIPQFKRDYPSITIKDIDIRNSQQYLAPKIDGAHVAIALRPERRIDTFSYRPSKKSTALIDHSFKSDLYKIKSPRSLGNTVLRGEVYGVDKKTGRVVPSVETAGLLNSSTWRSREEQKNRGVELQHLVFDIDRFKGKDVSALPYSQKLQLLNKVKQEIPQLNIVQPAKTVMDKELLIDSVTSGKNLLTHEGLVAYNLNESVPHRAKLRQDIDVYFHSPFVPRAGSRLEQSQSAGGYYASRQPGGEPTIRVGSGLSDAMRKDIAQYPEKYKNRISKIYIQEEYPSGKVRMPIHKEWRDVELWSKKQSAYLPNPLEHVEKKLKLSNPKIENIHDRMKDVIKKGTATKKLQAQIIGEIARELNYPVNNVVISSRLPRKIRKLWPKLYPGKRPAGLHLTSPDGSIQQIYLNTRAATQIPLNKLVAHEIGHGSNPNGGEIVAEEFSRKHHEKVKQLLIDKYNKYNPGKGYQLFKDAETRLETANYIRLDSKPRATSSNIAMAKPVPENMTLSVPSTRPDVKSLLISNTLQPDKTRVKKAGVIDPVQSIMDPQLWSGDHMLPQIRLHILQCIANVLGHETYKVRSVKLIGASATYQWTEDTDIDVNVGFDLDSKDLDIYAEMFKHSNPHPLSGTKHVINLFANKDDGTPETEWSLSNTLAVYDILSDTWIKPPDSKGQNVQWLIEQERPYINLFRHTIGRTVHNLRKTIDRRESPEEIKRKAMEVVVLYKLLDNARKLQFSKGWGVPNVTPSNIDYKITMKNPSAEKGENLYHILKKELYPEF